MIYLYWLTSLVVCFGLSVGFADSIKAFFTKKEQDVETAIKVKIDDAATKIKEKV